MTNQLKACPFCGGEATFTGGPENWKPTFYDPDSGGEPCGVACRECGAMVDGFEDYGDAATAWNRRAEVKSDETVHA